MKKILFIIAIAAISYNLFSQKEIQELDNWSTKGDSTQFVVKVSGESEAKNMYTIDFAPDILDLEAGTGTITKSAAYIPMEIGGTEYKCRMDTANPDIIDLPSDNQLSTADYLTFYDNTQSRDESITYGFFITDIGNESSMQTIIGTKITNTVNDNFLQTYIQSDTTFTFTYYTPSRDGSMYLTKIGDIVNGYITLDYAETNSGPTLYTASESLTSTYRPEADVFVVYGSGLIIYIDSDGTIKIIDTESGDNNVRLGISSTDINYSFSYITP